MRSKLALTQAVQELLTEIEDQGLISTWKLSASSIFESIGVKYADFARYLYIEHDNIYGSLDLVDNFCPENIDLLVGFLKWLGFDNIAQFFFQAGYYLSPERGAEWLEFCQSVNQSRMQNHQIDQELMELALAGCRYFQDAAEFYCHSIFTVEECIDYAAKIYIKKQSMKKHKYSYTLLRNFMYSQFSSQTFLERILYAGCMEKLYQKYGQTQDDPLQEEDCFLPLTQAMPEKLAQALRTLGFELSQNCLPSRKLVRKRYCQLLKQYHPDMQKQKNTEEIHAIITAYAEFTQYIELSK